jgi:hypothetical protein
MLTKQWEMTGQVPLLPLAVAIQLCTEVSHREACEFSHIAGRRV